MDFVNSTRAAEDRKRIKDGKGLLQNHLWCPNDHAKLWDRRFCRAQCKEKGKVDRRRGSKTILRSGQGWTLLPQLGQLKTGLGGKGLL